MQGDSMLPMLVMVVIVVGAFAIVFGPQFAASRTARRKLSVFAEAFPGEVKPTAFGRASFLGFWNDRQFSIDINEHTAGSNGRSSFIVTLLVPCRFTMETWPADGDALLFCKLGINKRAKTGDADFDSKLVFNTSDAGAAQELFFAPEARAAIGKIYQNRFRLFMTKKGPAVLNMDYSSDSPAVPPDTVREMLACLEVVAKYSCVSETGVGITG